MNLWSTYRLWKSMSYGVPDQVPIDPSNLTTGVISKSGRHITLWSSVKVGNIFPDRHLCFGRHRSNWSRSCSVADTPAGQRIIAIISRRSSVWFGPSDQMILTDQPLCIWAASLDETLVSDPEFSFIGLHEKVQHYCQCDLLHIRIVFLYLD